MAENHQHASKGAIALRAIRMPALLFLIIAGFYWRLTLTRQYTWLDNPDGVYQVLPWFQFQAAAFHQGQLPLWDPYEWAGQPLVGQVQPGTAYPLNWILFSLPLHRGFIRYSVLQWYFVIIHFMAALFCYLLCRDLGRSRGASLLAGTAFGLAGWMGTTDWPQMLNSALWTPLIFLFLLRVMRGYRIVASAALAGTFLGVAYLAGHHQIPIFVSLASAAFWIYLFFRNGRPDWNLWRPVLAFGGLCFLVGALQSLPAWEAGKLSVRWIGMPDPVTWNQPVPYDIHTGLSLFPLSILGIVVPGITRNANPFLGVGLISLAFLAVATNWRESVVRWFAWLGMGGLVFSLANFGFFHGLLYGLLPLLDKARNPSTAIFIFHFAVIILSAYAIDNYRSIQTSSFVSRTWRFLLVFAGVLYIALLFRTLGSFHGGPDADPIALEAFVALLLAATLYAWDRGNLGSRTAYALLFSFVLMETALFSSSEWRNRDQPNFYYKNILQDPDIAAFIKQHKEPVRVEINNAQIPYNFGDWYGVDVLGGYLASLTANVHRAQEVYQGRMLAGTNFYIGAQPTRANQTEVYATPRGLRVFSNPEAFRRAWSVHRADSIGAEQDIGVRLDRALSDLRERTFVVGGAPALQTCAATDQVDLLHRGINDLTVVANMQCRGMVVVGETYYPGWRATVDGRSVPVYQAYGFLRGVVVDGGRHRIEMHYQPRSVYRGAALTSIGFLIAAIIGFSGRRARPPLKRS